MWQAVLDRFLSGMMVRDRLTVRFADGTTQHYGPDSGQSVSLQFTDDATVRALCLNPQLALGEAYMDQRVVLHDGSIVDVLKLLERNRASGTWPGWLRAASGMRYLMRRFVQHNAPKQARQNVAHHYDISDDLYAMFLDTDMQYSCAYFPESDMTLEQAQEAKKAHIARKLCIEPGSQVLDIGCGWGGMSLTLARDFGAQVTGITLSQNQLTTARRRAAQEGLSDKVSFELLDYRQVQGRFDRIVSVGMLEHVGVPNYGTYFSRVADLLAPDGVALIHSIGRSAPPSAHDPWINKYIFPGGYTPSLSELAGPMERAQLWQTDIEIWRLHYARTLRHWRDRFTANEDQIKTMYDARFIRMFHYYFAAAITAFEEQMLAVYQIQMAHKRDAVPLTRDYLYPSD